MSKDDTGVWSVTTSPLQPELWACTFSANGVFADPAATTTRLKLFFFSCGTEDNRIEALTKVESNLRARQVNFTFKRYAGEHEWKVWRHSLADMAPMLFR